MPLPGSKGIVSCIAEALAQRDVIKGDVLALSIQVKQSASSVKHRAAWHVSPGIWARVNVVPELTRASRLGACISSLPNAWIVSLVIRKQAKNVWPGHIKLQRKSTVEGTDAHRNPLPPPHGETPDRVLRASLGVRTMPHHPPRR